MSRFYEALRQATRSLQGENVELDEDLAESMAELADTEQRATAQAPPLTSFTADAMFDTVVEPSAEQNLLGVTTHATLNQKARVIPNSGEPMLAEHYRQLRTKLLQRQERKGFRSLLVTSAYPGEGKTVMVLNLALIFRMLPSYRVLVIDGDLRKGDLSSCLGIAGRPGLGNLLEGTAALKDVVLKSDEVPFHFMGLGNSKVSPPDLVHSSRWPAKVHEISERFDLVLVDSPPATLVTDAHLLAAGCDAVLLVARAFRTSRTAFQKLQRELQQYQVIGCVLNGGPGEGSYRRYKYYSGKSS